MERDALTLNMDCPFLFDLLERMEEEEKKKLYPTGYPVLPATPKKAEEDSYPLWLTD